MNKRTKYTPENLDCTNCVEYIYGVGCIALECPCLAERFDAGAVGYDEAVAYTFSFNPRLLRLHTLIGDFPGTMWRNEQHKQRFLSVSGKCTNRSNSYYAAVYLLTASQSLCKRASLGFCRMGLNFKGISVQGISGGEYALLSYAKRLYKGDTIPSDELIDESLVSPEQFQLIVNSMIIAKHGMSVLKISKITTTKEKEDVSISSEQGT